MAMPVNPFASPEAAAAAAAGDDASPFELAVFGGAALAPTPAEAGPSGAQPLPAPHKRPALRRRLLGCCACLGGDATRPDLADSCADFELSPRHGAGGGPSGPGGPKKVVTWQADALSPRKSLQRGKPSAASLKSNSLRSQGSAAYSDADWYDARSEFSTALSSAASDALSKLEEVSAMVRELGALTPARAPWIPEAPLAFGEPGMQFVPVPAVTGFAFYWERDDERTTPFPQPIDLLTKASYMAQKSHASIPGIWLQETDGAFTVTVKPRFVPPGLPRYTETYDKSNATEPSWNLRRDLRLGSTSGRIFMTADGMLILQAHSRPMFGGEPDFVMEEYMRLEDGGTVVVDRMCCMCLKSGKRATQYLVGRRHLAPPKGHI